MTSSPRFSELTRTWKLRLPTFWASPCSASPTSVASQSARRWTCFGGLWVRTGTTAKGVFGSLGDLVRVRTARRQRWTASRCRSRRSRALAAVRRAGCSHDQGLQVRCRRRRTLWGECHQTVRPWWLFSLPCAVGVFIADLLPPARRGPLHALAVAAVMFVLVALSVVLTEPRTQRRAVERAARFGPGTGQRSPAAGRAKEQVRSELL